MAVLKYFDYKNAAYQIVSSGSNGSPASPVFLERAHLIGTGVSTLTLYDGGDTNGRVVGILGCVANSSDDIIIEDKCKNGLRTVMTTGAGIAKAIIYSR